MERSARLNGKKRNSPPRKSSESRRRSRSRSKKRNTLLQQYLKAYPKKRAVIYVYYDAAGDYIEVPIEPDMTLRYLREQIIAQTNGDVHESRRYHLLNADDQNITESDRQLDRMLFEIPIEHENVVTLVFIPPHY